MNIPRWVLVWFVLFLIVAAAFFTYLGSELRRQYFALAPLNRTLALSRHPTLDRTAHVYIKNAAAGVSVHAFVYEGAPDWVSYGHDLGQIGTAPSMQAAVASFGVIQWTNAGLTIGPGSATDPVVLTKQQIESSR